MHFIGAGIVLITVSGVAWRLTATDSPSCAALLGLNGTADLENVYGDCPHLTGRAFLARVAQQLGAGGGGGGQTVNGGGGGGGHYPSAAAAAAARAQHPYAGEECFCTPLQIICTTGGKIEF